MKRLFENWRKFLLTESAIDPKIMKMIDKAEEMGLKVKLLPSVVIISHPMSNDVVASVSWDKDKVYGDCLGTAHVTGAQAEHGLGPLAYEIAIEKTGGLASDRTTVSPAATAVWDYYMDNRSDIKVDQLDILDNYLEPQLTPKDKSDDCEQVQAYNNREHEWHTSSLSKKYSKSGTPVMAELDKRGMLEKK